MDIGKLETTHLDLSKLSCVVKNEVHKYDHNTKINEIEKKITDNGHRNNYITTH